MKEETVHAKPGWVLFGGCILAFLAAAVNADFMLRVGVSVSHLSGDLSRIASQAGRGAGHWSREAVLLILTVSGFVGGAATAGFFIHHPNLQLVRPYGRSVIFVGLLLLATHPAGRYSVPLACFMAAWACGMQNALATRYRGLILRTTHITGLLTDFGQLIGMRLRGHPIESWKITTPFALAASFAAGAAAGSVVNLATSIPVTVVCGALYVTGGALWSVAKRRPHLPGG
ncbi:YoaK family protein [Luteolibacter sp. Populi]|uniref:YoaK family protein n=1 Tax=Luteolibacter sp. Populi TaxID=3230487 RepID=UPI0034666532